MDELDFSEFDAVCVTDPGVLEDACAAGVGVQSDLLNKANTNLGLNNTGPNMEM